MLLDASVAATANAGSDRTPHQGWCGWDDVTFIHSFRRGVGSTHLEAGFRVLLLGLSVGSTHLEVGEFDYFARKGRVQQLGGAAVLEQQELLGGPLEPCRIGIVHPQLLVDQLQGLREAVHCDTARGDGFRIKI